MPQSARSRKTEIAARVLQATGELRDRVAALSFAEPVTHVYNPLVYAWDLHRAYVERWGNSRRRVLLLGMNPGPWGMVQTGVPFGEVAHVREWLGLDGLVNKPDVEHPKRPVQGLACARSEVSGRRLWGFFAEKFGTPEAFFADHIIINYCPLTFMEESGRNRPPDKLPAAETAGLFAACDDRLRTLVEIYRPEWGVGVGAFARKKLESLFRPKKGGPDDPNAVLKIGQLLHPSPASPAANRGWAQAAARQLTEQGIWD